MDQAAERYLKKLRRALVCSKRDKERLIADGKDLLENFSQENPGAFYQDYIASFGRPEDFAGEMLANLDPEDVHEAGQRRKRALMGIVAAVAAVLVLLAGVWLGQRSQPGSEVPTPTPEQTVTPTAEATSEPTPEPTPASGPVTLVERQFVDYADIAHKEAVGTVVALGIIRGKEDGSYFDPDGYVTRGEAAKLIFLMMQGGSDADMGVKEEPTFTDIQGHWAESYIEYCADMGIVGTWETPERWETKTFDPNGLVTGVELLRMCLISLGYDAEAYHLMGESWMSQVLERARATNGRRLIEGLEDVVFMEPVTRDAVAQMLYNTLLANVMTVSPEVNTTTEGDEVVWHWESKDMTFLEQRFALKPDEIVYECPPL